MPDQSLGRRTRVREITTAADPAFRAAHELLRREFPRAEMLPVRDWRNAMRERREGLWTDVSWHLLVAERDGQVLGAASGSYLGNVNTGVIGYVAVKPEARSFGLGPRLRRALLRRFGAQARRLGHNALRAIVGEVREDSPWLRHLVRHESAIALDFDYVQPSLGGNRAPVSLVMYYQPHGRPKKTLGVAELRKLLFTIWRRAYRVSRPLSHPEFRRMLRSLGERRRIGQRELPMSRRSRASRHTRSAA
jgi:GNAT superfamily N-acetyltransferase